MAVYGLTLETTVETFILGFVTALAVVSVGSLVRLFRRVRGTDKTVLRLTRWARRAGRHIDIPYDDEGDQ